MAGFYGSLLVKISYLVVHKVGPVPGQGRFHDDCFDWWHNWRFGLKLQQVAGSDGLEDEAAVRDLLPGSEVLRQAACLGDERAVLVVTFCDFPPTGPSDHVSPRRAAGERAAP